MATSAQIKKLAQKFAEDVLEVIAGDTKTAKAPKKAAKVSAKATKKTAGKKGPGRTRGADVEEAIGIVVAAVNKAGEIRAEALRAELEMDKKLFQKAVAAAKSQRLIGKKGNRRTTAYTSKASKNNKATVEA